MEKETKEFSKVEALMKYTKKQIIDLLLKKILELKELKEKFEKSIKDYIDNQSALNKKIYDYEKRNIELNEKFAMLEINNKKDIEKIQSLSLQITELENQNNELEYKIRLYKEYCELESKKHQHLLEKIQKKGLSWDLDLTDLF